MSVCPSPTAPSPLIVLSQITSLWSLSCISNCQCFRSLPLRLPDFRVAISLIPSLFNATPRNLGFKRSLVMCFHCQAAALRIFRSGICVLWRRAYSLLRDHLGGWRGWVEAKKKQNSVWSLHLNEHPYWFRALCPVFAYLRQNAALEQNCCLSIFLLWLLKRIFILTVHFYSTWKNMLAFHFHADHGTICPLSLDLLAGG